MSSYLQRAIKAIQHNQHGKAILICLEGLEKSAASADLYNTLGVAVKGTGAYAEAEAPFRSAIQLNPQLIEAWNNLGSVLKTLGRLEEAFEIFQQSFHLNATHSATLVGLGNTLCALGFHEEAVPFYQAAFDANPDDPVIQWNFALALLALGEYEAAWPLYEARWALGEPYPYLRKKAWRGESLNGCTLFIWGEQGLGDQVQMLRYLPLLKACFPKNIMLCASPSLKRLCQISFPSVEWVDSMNAMRNVDYHIPLMSLPLLFKTTRQSIPMNVPYLLAYPDHPLKALSGFKVGLVWSTTGAAGAFDDSGRVARSCPLSLFEPLFSLAGIQWIVLQQGEAREEARFYPSLQMASAHFSDFLETASVISALDLVISIDTAVAHIAGALNKPVWIFRPHAGGDHFFDLQSDCHPWYPTARVFKQPTRGDWGSVVESVYKAFQAHLQNEGY